MRKMDEMELHISNNAIRWAWAFTVLALAGRSIWDVVRMGKITAPSYLLIFQNLLYFLAVQIGKWRAGDESGRTSILLCGAMTVVFLALGALLLWHMGR